jgi:hypothetical protein
MNTNANLYLAFIVICNFCEIRNEAEERAEDLNNTNQDEYTK